MSKCDLSIVFDRADRVYRAGETVSGRVEVDVNKNVKCNALKIEMLWQTHGKGNQDIEIIDEITEPDLEWTAGSMHSFPFRFKAPKMPLTYHGHYLNIDHYIKVRADIPWAIDPKTKEEFILEPGESSERDYRESLKDREEDKAEVKKSGFISEGCGWIIGILLIGMLMFFLFTFWFVFVILGVILGIVLLMKYMARKKLGQIRFEARDRIVVSGGTVRIDAGIAPDKPVKINAITLTLTAREVCVSGSGTRRTTHTNTMHEQEITLVSDYQTQGSGIPTDFKHDIRIPDLGAHTFKSRNNSISWEVRLHVDIPKYPDHRDRMELTVIPAAKTKA